MENQKPDRRVNRTRRNLRNALFSLILEKGYEAVTIEDITQLADVGRTTFYLHFKDKEDLLIESLDATIADFIERVSSLPISAWAQSLELNSEPGAQRSPVLLVFEHAAENANLYKVMLRGEGVSRAQNQVRNVIAGAVGEFIRQWVEKDHLVIHLSVPMDFFANYFAGSLMGILTWWLEQDMPYQPAQMALMFQRMLFPGAKEVLGVEITA